MLLGKSLSPCSNSSIKTLLERLVYPYGRSSANTPARRSLRSSSKEGQCDKKCLSSMPSCVGHIGLIVSLKLCLNL